MFFAVAVLSAVVVGAPPTPGRYEVTSDQVSVRKEVWSIYCDIVATEPKSTVGAKLDVTVTGIEWKAKGDGRLFGTGQCEAMNKGLEPEARSQKAGKVVMSCRSRLPTLGTEASSQKVWSTPDAIWFEVTSRRTFRHRGDDCISVLDRRTKAVLREAAAGATPPKPDPPSEAEQPAGAGEPEPAPEPCATLGSATTMVLSPRVAVAKVGGKPACFEVSAKDASGCVVVAETPTFSVEPADAGKIDKRGCFSAADVDDEQLIAIVAKVGALEADASVRVVPRDKAKSEATLVALAKTSKSERAKAVIGEVTRGEFVIRPLETVPELPPLEEPPFPWLPVGSAGLVALLATAAGVLVARRRRRFDDEPTELQAKPVVTPKKGGGMVCPQCAFEFAVGEATNCPFDGTVLDQLNRDARQTMFIPAAGGMVCPKCHTKYPTKARFCGIDRSPLIPDFGQFPSSPPADDGA